MSRLLAIGLAVTTLTGPPGALFRAGYDLCHAAPLSAIRAAGGQPYAVGRFVNGSCLWERPDLAAGVSLSMHSSSSGRQVMRQLVTQSGHGAFRARRVHIPGALDGVLVTVAGRSRTVTKYLLAAYRQGVVQVNMAAPGVLPDGRLLAVLRAVAGA